MPYQYAVYNVQDQARSVATNAKIAAMEADGWRPHTVGCNFAELCIFWEKPAASREEEQPDQDKPAPRPKKAAAREPDL